MGFIHFINERLEETHNSLSWEEKYSYYEDFFFLQEDTVDFPDYGITYDTDTNSVAGPKAEGKVSINR